MKAKTPICIPDQIDEIAERLYARFVGSEISVIGQELRLRLLLEQNIKPGATVPFGLDRLDVWQTAEYLGLKAETLRDRVKRRKLGMPEPFTIGKKLAWRRSELDQWVEGQRTGVKTNAPQLASEAPCRRRRAWPATAK
jgi:predicted DNA-binding transcriptional regulator AlpA